MGFFLWENVPIPKEPAAPSPILQMLVGVTYNWVKQQAGKEVKGTTRVLCVRPLFEAVSPAQRCE